MKRLVKFSFSLALTAAFSWWAFRDAPLAEQWKNLQAAHYGWVVLYFGVLLAIHLCRTVRWGCLLSKMGRVSFQALNESAAIGFMMLLVLPLRLGEFARPVLLAKRSGIRRSAAMATVVLERIVDGLSVAVLLRFLLFFLPPSSPNLRLVRVAANAMFLIFAGGLAFLLFALWQHRRAVGAVRRALELFSPQAAQRAAETVDVFVGAIRLFPSGWQAVLFVFYTALYWFLNACGLCLLSRAFSCGVGQGNCLPFGLDLFQGLVAMCVLVVGVMIPSAPGMVGTFQAAIRYALTLFLPMAVVTGKGMAYANVAWFCQTAAQIGLGLIFMGAGHLSFKEVSSSEDYQISR